MPLVRRREYAWPAGYNDGNDESVPSQGDEKTISLDKRGRMRRQVAPCYQEECKETLAVELWQAYGATSAGDTDLTKGQVIHQ